MWLNATRELLSSACPQVSWSSLPLEVWMLQAWSESFPGELSGAGQDTVEASPSGGGAPRPGERDQGELAWADEVLPRAALAGGEAAGPVLSLPAPDGAPRGSTAAEPLVFALRPARTLRARLLLLRPELEGITVERFEHCLLLDALAIPASGGVDPLRADIHRTLLRLAGLPGAHAQACWGGGERLRWPALGAAELASFLRGWASKRAAGADGAALQRALEAALLRLNLARFRALAAADRGPSGAPAQPPLSGAASLAIARGRRALDSSPGCPASWEHQNTGSFGRAAIVGDLFGPLLVARCLAALDLPAARALLAEVSSARSAHGLRFYRDTPEIPHDADDAAALLLANSACGPGGVDERLLSLARQVLQGLRAPGGALQTYMELPGEEAAPPLEQWFGIRGPGIAGRALQAMAEDGRVLSLGELEETATWLASRAEAAGSFRPCYYPSRSVTTALVYQGLEAAWRRLDEAGRGGGLLPALRRAEAWLWAAQAPDGAWGSAMGTASVLLALCSGVRPGGHLPPGILMDASAALLRTQRWDGSWPADGYYFTQWCDGAWRPFGSSALTTAYALAALTLASERVGQSAE